MSSDNRDLSYSGPEKEYQPPIGSNRPIAPYQKAITINAADKLDSLRKELLILEEKSNSVISKSEKELSELFLNLNVSEERKTAAVNIWSNFNEQSNNLVSFKQIKELENNIDRFSKYVVSEYKKDLRKPNGSSAIDIRDIAHIILGEIQKMSQIVNAKIIENNSGANDRFVELFLEWTVDVKDHLERLNSFFGIPRKQRNKIIPKDELNSVSYNDAVKYQALFTVNVNALNQEIDDKLNEIKRTFLNHSDIFYQKVVYPLLNLDVNITEELRTTMDRTELSALTTDTRNAINRNIVVSLYDAADRNEKFNTSLVYIEERISARENYLSYIRQLEEKGKKSPTNLVEFKEENNLSLKIQPTQSLFNSHNTLTSREADDAHPQYLLRSGDTLSGDLSFKDDTLLDGISPSKHVHSGGADGQKITGTSIVNHSLPSSSVGSVNVDKPIDLQILSIKPSQLDVECDLVWFVKNEVNIYEIDFALIPDKVFVDPE